ncbi:MAG: RecX family transcriptional regulator [Clostridiales bacterium]|nr:RecX family transcriptional regulator [Candidatus Crickella caballi]
MSESKGKNKKSAMECAISYLAGSMRTCDEVRKHLEKKEYGTVEIEETVKELTDLRYIDDYQYALRYYEYNYSRNRGSGRAQQALASKGVDRSIIRNAYEDYMYENNADEYELAYKLAEKELYITPDLVGEDAEPKRREISDKLLARIARKLQTRGFSVDIVARVLSRIRGME